MKTQSSLFAASLFAALSLGCFQQEVGNVEVLLEDKINGEDGDNIQFAIFGAAEQNGVVSMVVIASDNPDLCGEVGGDAAAFLLDIEEGQIASDFVVTTILADGQLADGVTFRGDNQENQLVAPSFVIGNGAEALVIAIDKDAEADFTIDTFDGNTMAGKLVANLNQEGEGLFGTNDINVRMDVNIFTSQECAALTEFAQAQL